MFWDQKCILIFEGIKEIRKLHVYHSCHLWKNLQCSKFYCAYYHFDSLGLARLFFWGKSVSFRPTAGQPKLSGQLVAYAGQVHNVWLLSFLLCLSCPQGQVWWKLRDDLRTCKQPNWQSNWLLWRRCFDSADGEPVVWWDRKRRAGDSDQLVWYTPAWLNWVTTTTSNAWNCSRS